MRGDAGQAFPLVIVVAGMMGAAALLLAQLGGSAVQMARAQSAADAAALAGARFGEAAAEEMARRNGAELITAGVSDEATGRFEVEVLRGGARAVAGAAHTENQGFLPPPLGSETLLPLR